MRWLLAVALLLVASVVEAQTPKAPNCIRATLETPGYWGWGTPYRKPDGYWYQEWTYFPPKSRAGYFCNRPCERYTIQEEEVEEDEEEYVPPPKPKPKPKPAPCKCGCSGSKPKSKTVEIVDGEIIETKRRPIGR